jgi:hypothetical protein
MSTLPLIKAFNELLLSMKLKSLPLIRAFNKLLLSTINCFLTFNFS